MTDPSKARVISKKLNRDGTGTVTLHLTEDSFASLMNEKPDLAKGSFLPRDSGIGMGARYGLRDSQVVKVPTERKEMIRLSRSLYKYEPVIANVIDLMVDLCLTGMVNEGPNAKAEEFFDNYCKWADFDSLHRSIFLEIFLSSDPFIMRGKLKKWGEGDNDFYHEYTVLNPEYVEVAGTMLLNNEVITLRVPNDIQELMKLDSPEGKRLAKEVPLKLRRGIESGKYTPDQELVSRISRKRQPYERYATPFLSRVFEPALLKRRMREADTALAETVRSVLVTITVGNDNFPATPKDLDSVVEVFQNPSKSQEIIWNHTLDVKYHYPDADLFSGDKYEQVNKDIIQGLGIPPVLIDGGGGTFATAWTSLLSVVERLESLRNQVVRWQESEYRKIAVIAGIKDKDIPDVKFKPLNLRDDKVFANIITSLWDRGLISAETTMGVAGLDFDAEIRKITAEKKSLGDIIQPRSKSNPMGGRPSDTLDEGNYSGRDRTPSPKGGEETTNEQADKPR